MMSSLRPYQELAIDVVCRDKRKALIMAMGLGKTLVSLKCMDRLACPRYLIIAPRRVIDSSWRPEIDKWQAMLPILSRYPLIDLTGSIKQRHTAYCRYCSIPSSICFTTPDLVHAILPLAIETKHLRACWDGVIVDESSFFPLPQVATHQGTAQSHGHAKSTHPTHAHRHPPPQKISQTTGGRYICSMEASY